MKEVISEALSCIESLVSGRNSKEEILQRFRTRARSIPADLYIHGLAYTLTIIAARSSKDALEKGLTGMKCVDVIKSVEGMFNGVEEKSYGIYGAIITYLLKKAEIIKSNTFKELINEVLNNYVIDLRAREVFEWLKRFAEAYIPGE
jgi:CRISPR type III-B/RAMP module-associated protein Cmr5